MFFHSCICRWNFTELFCQGYVLPRSNMEVKVPVSATWLQDASDKTTGHLWSESLGALPWRKTVFLLELSKTKIVFSLPFWSHFFPVDFENFWVQLCHLSFHQVRLKVVPAIPRSVSLPSLVSWRRRLAPIIKCMVPRSRWSTTVRASNCSKSCQAAESWRSD